MESNLTNPYHHFLRMVYKMRRVQKEAKRFQFSKSVQVSAASLEREVDKWLEQCGLEASKVRQLSMPVEEPKDEPA